MTDLSTAKKSVLVLALSAILLAVMLYEMSYPTVFPMLKQSLIRLLTNIPIFTKETSLAFLNSPTLLL